MANAYDPREFIFLGQIVDTFVSWHGGPPPENVVIDGNTVRLWDNPNTYNHNVFTYPFYPGTKPFELWKWFINNVSTIEEYDWTTQVDEYTRHIWAFNANGLVDWESVGSASFFIGLISPINTTRYFLVSYDAGYEVDFQYNNRVYQWLDHWIDCQKTSLHYLGFSPNDGLTINDRAAGACWLFVNQTTFLPDVTGFNINYDSICLVQNGYYKQQNAIDGDTTLYNDLTGNYVADGIGWIVDNMSGDNYGVVARSQNTDGYWPSVSGGRIFTNMYEMTGLYGQYINVPWHNPDLLPLIDFTIETSNDDVEPPEEEGGDGEYIQDDDTQQSNSTPGGSGGGGGTGGGGTGVTASGMAHLYAPTKQQMEMISSYLWDDSFIASISRLFKDDPINSIITLGYLPINLSEFRGTQEWFKIGNNIVQAPVFPLTQDYLPLDAGYIEVKEKWGSALDYDPYSLAELYLPFIGYVKLSMSDILYPATKATGGSAVATGKIYLYYKVNAFTGDCVAQVFAEGVPQTAGEIAKQHMIGQYTGNCMEYIPFSGVNYSNYYKGQVQNLALGVGGFAAGLVSGNPMMGGMSLAASAMNAVNQPPQVQRSGGSSGGASRLQYMKPFLRLTRPAQSLALAEPDGSLNQKGYKNLEGVACNFYVEKLDDCLGFTAVETVELKGIGATDTEMTEIETLLKNGVFIGTGH